MPVSVASLVVITDVDGTLIDHNTHEWDAARAWLTRLEAHQVPVVLCSSKTAAELTGLQKVLGLDGQPFIAENGAVISLDASWSDHPDYPRLLTGARHEEIRTLLEQLRDAHGYKFTTVSDVDEQTLSEWSGLTPKMAALAKLQEASETLIWRDSDPQLAAFTAALSENGLMMIEGGRFWHVLDQQGGKDQAIAWLMKQYRQRRGNDLVTLGLGDAPGDAPLLDATDYTVVVKGYSRNAVTLKQDTPERVYRTAEYGPAGWSEGLTHFLGEQ